MHIERLAATPRPTGSLELQQTRAYVHQCLQSFGWQIAAHEFVVNDDYGAPLAGTNLVARHPEHSSPAGPQFCLGAHTDSTPHSPGADDNASGVAGLLEIARLLPERWPTRARLGLELVAFELEENGMLGGAEHARLCRQRQIDLRGMVALEMIGYRNHAPRSQSLPRTLVGKYPDTGNFIAVIGNQNSGPLIERFSAGMRKVPGLPVETLQVPSNGELLQATRLSDHSPFWDAGYAALMITDTSFLRNPHYHLASDTLETLDLEFLQQVTQGCLEATRLILAEGL
jgi:Zn-dependent M28 family amino/carboxypeptidase